MIQFPTNEFETINTEESGWDEQRLDAAFEFARERNTIQFLVSVNGAIVKEGYWHSSAEETGDIYSAQKSLVAVLTGIAQQQGLLSLSDSVASYLGSGWTKLSTEVESQVTIQHLMSMTTGMDDNLEAMGTVGQSWHYNTPAYQCLKRVLPKAAGISMQDLTRKWVTDPLGMKSTRWIPRENMTFLDGEPMTGLYSNVRDMARLGVLMLAGGDWNSNSIVEDKSFFSNMTRSSQSLNPAYGYLWWINGQQKFMVPFMDRVFEGSMVPHAPDDMVMCLGAADQKIYVVPSWSAVITRRGGSASKDDAMARSSFDNELWEKLSAARIK
jgi:CubicO group peptidase (beta-lactamase class C family)